MHFNRNILYKTTMYMNNSNRESTSFIYKKILSQLNPLNDNVSIQEVVQQYGVSRSSIYRIIATFERENPLEAELMKKQGKDVTPEDYKKLLEELSSLKKALAEERLRADFYQEMVAYGEEVYGIKLKKLAPSSS